MKTRIYFLDNLRTFLIFLVVLIHAGLVYEPVLENTWIVVDPVKNSSIGLIRMYLDLFVMFIIFFISGYFIPNSLKSKSSWEFVKSKFKRIMLPWIVAVLTLIPAYKVIFLYSRGFPQEEWYSYFHIFQRAGSDLSYFANNPAQSWLWFLPVLFLFQVVYLLMAKTNLLNFKISLKIGVVLVFLVGLVYSLVISYTDMRGWYHSALLHFQRERLLVYFLAFLLGSLSNKLKVFESNNKNRKVYIVSNVVLTFSISVFTAVALNLFFNMVDPVRNYFFISEPVDRFLYYTSALLSMLSFLYILIHVFRFNFNKNSSLLSELNRNSYSVYIIHMIVLGLIALILVKIPIPSMIKYFVLTILTFVISNIIVSAYNYLFQSKMSVRIAKVAMLVIAFLSVIFFGNNDGTATDKLQPVVLQTTVSQPAVGLHMAAIQGNMAAVRMHIESESDLNVTEPSGGSSPLISAAVFGKTEVAVALIEAGADVNFKNNEGSTPLHTAAFFCRPDIVEALLANGADKTLKNKGGSNALESVTVPFEVVEGIYDYFRKTLGPLGLELDYEQIKMTRPDIAEMLQ